MPLLRMREPTGQNVQTFCPIEVALQGHLALLIGLSQQLMKHASIHIELTQMPGQF